MKLKSRQRCPIHGSFFCCGRETKTTNHVTKTRKNETKIGPGVFKIADEHSPKGYRIRRTKAAMDQLLAKKVEEQKGRCFYCKELFSHVREVTPDHREPRGMGGSRRCDSEDNIVAACATCNSEKGSKRL